MASIIHFDASAPLEDISAQLDEDAAVIIDNVLSGDQLSALRSDLDPYLHDVPHGRNDLLALVGLFKALSATVIGGAHGHG